MTSALTFNSFGNAVDIFAKAGEDMRTHKGRSVVVLSIDGRTHYLKRYWFVPSRWFKRHVARGFHEMRMIDWLNDHGFAGPKIVQRGGQGVYPFYRQVYFLMEEVSGELQLEATWRRHAAETDELLGDLACFAARLHDAGFVHTDFSEGHILTSRGEDGWRFRLIDVERAGLERPGEQRPARDLATLAASVMNDRLRRRIRTDFIERYIAARNTLSPGVDFRAIFGKARPTKGFS